MPWHAGIVFLGWSPPQIGAGSRLGEGRGGLAYMGFSMVVWELVGEVERDWSAERLDAVGLLWVRAWGGLDGWRLKTAGIGYGYNHQSANIQTVARRIKRTGAWSMALTSVVTG